MPLSDWRPCSRDCSTNLNNWTIRYPSRSKIDNCMRIKILTIKNKIPVIRICLQLQIKMKYFNKNKNILPEMSLKDNQRLVNRMLKLLKFRMIFKKVLNTPYNQSLCNRWTWMRRWQWRTRSWWTSRSISSCYCRSSNNSKHNRSGTHNAQSL